MSKLINISEAIAEKWFQFEQNTPIKQGLVTAKFKD